MEAAAQAASVLSPGASAVTSRVAVAILPTSAAPRPAAAVVPSVHAKPHAGSIPDARAKHPDAPELPGRAGSRHAGCLVRTPTEAVACSCGDRPSRPTRPECWRGTEGMPP